MLCPLDFLYIFLIILAKYTFAYSCTVDEYLHKVMVNNEVAEYVFKFQGQLKRLMESSYCEVSDVFKIYTHG